MKKKIQVITRLLVGILGVLVVVFLSQFWNTEAEISASEIEPKEEIEIAPIVEFGFVKEDYNWSSDRIKSNQFLSNILLPHGVDYVTIDAIAKKSKEVYDVRKLLAGKPYHVIKSKDSSNQVLAFIYQPNAIDYVVYDLRDSLHISKGEKPVVIEEKSLSGIINSSLYLSLTENNASPALAVRMADIFAWSIDFYGIQKGDWFKVIYEVKKVDGEAIGIGGIKAIQFNHINRDFYAFHFENEEQEDYFDEKAESLRKAFLKSPLKFSRLSSRYSRSRFHPVQKRWKAHLGTDYAAPTGTPIMSTGDGVVVESKRKRANGNYVKVKHNSAYTTQYLHMSKRNVKVGQAVKQGDIIGYVGSTGLATGPHVCYRFWENGKQVDHLRQDFPSAEPILEKYMNDFEAIKKKLEKQLEAITLDEENTLSLQS